MIFFHRGKIGNNNLAIINKIYKYADNNINITKKTKFIYGRGRDGSGKIKKMVVGSSYTI